MEGGRGSREARDDRSSWAPGVRFLGWFAILLATGVAAVSIGSGLAALIFLARYLLGVAIAVDALRAARQMGSLWIAPAYEPIGVAVGLCTGVLLMIDRRVAWGGRDYRV